MHSIAIDKNDGCFAFVLYLGFSYNLPFKDSGTPMIRIVWLVLEVRALSCPVRVTLRLPCLVFFYDPHLSGFFSCRLSPRNLSVCVLCACVFRDIPLQPSGVPILRSPRDKRHNVVLSSLLWSSILLLTILIPSTVVVFLATGRFTWSYLYYVWP